MTRPRPSSVATRVALAALVTASIAGCLPAAATDRGRDIGTLYVGFLIAAGFVALTVLVPTTVAIIRFRRRTDVEPPQRRGNDPLEIGWTLAAAAVVVGLFIGTYAVLTRVDDVSGRDAVEVDVLAYRWGWRFTYPATGVVIDGTGPAGPEVAVPVGQPVTIRLEAADVIHSFYVPLFLFKRDAIPGRTNVFQFTVETAGTYRGQCAEFCGVGHSQMPFTIVAMDRAGFDRWSAAARAAGS